CQQHNTYPLTF
nr:immunoglobulin light chain junction region [Macaca mulatta]MOV61264.1 immunoglobulin light chain junction region [Macaca mulatta]MOV61481.1 immunoglobulin light chain junction region [Macaca mulatta]MOV61981.1 immunoglobulin light chain junction region [Macaca mulatta]MOV62039.1 immunoglobulin light chain junction region [Macaca mulatta]